MKKPWREREKRCPFVRARVARLSRLPLFLAQGTTTPRVKHADEGLSSCLSSILSIFPGASVSCSARWLYVLTNQSKEGVRIRADDDEGECRRVPTMFLFEKRDETRVCATLSGGAILSKELKRSSRRAHKRFRIVSFSNTICDNQAIRSRVYVIHGFVEPINRLPVDRT